MSFQPILPSSGYAGWTFLQRSLPMQQDLHARSPIISRESDYLRSKLGSFNSLDDLMADRRAMRIVLTSQGLAQDIPNRAFIEKVLTSDLTDPRSFANRLSDKRYSGMAALLTPEKGVSFAKHLSNVAGKIVTGYQRASFEEALGQKDGDMRLALAFERDMKSVLDQYSSPTSQWYAILGTPSLRAVLEPALNLPSSFAKVPIDRQLTEVMERTRKLTGSSEPSSLLDPEKNSKLMVNFFTKKLVAQMGAISPMANALTLLRGMGGG